MLFQRDIEGITAQGLVMDAVAYFGQGKGRCMVVRLDEDGDVDEEHCTYRSADGGHACVVGSYLSEDEMTHLHSVGISNAHAGTVVRHLWRREWPGGTCGSRWLSATKHHILITELQEVHDSWRHWNEDGSFSETGWHALAKAAEEHGVSPLALERGGE